MKCIVVIVSDAVIVLVVGAALAPVMLMGLIDSGLIAWWLGLADIYFYTLAIPLAIEWPRDGIIAALRRYREGA